MNASCRAALGGVGLLGFALIALSNFVGTASAGPVTWPSSAGGNGHSYELILDNGLSWSGAQSYASQHGGYLVTEQNSQEVQFVNNVLGTANAPTGSYWMGV